CRLIDEAFGDGILGPADADSARLRPAKLLLQPDATTDMVPVGGHVQSFDDRLAVQAGLIGLVEILASYLMWQSGGGQPPVETFDGGHIAGLETSDFNAHGSPGVGMSVRGRRLHTFLTEQP